VDCQGILLKTINCDSADSRLPTGGRPFVIGDPLRGWWPPHIRVVKVKMQSNEAPTPATIVLSVRWSVSVPGAGAG